VPRQVPPLAFSSTEDTRTISSQGFACVPVLALVFATKADHRNTRVWPITEGGQDQRRLSAVSVQPRGELDVMGGRDAILVDEVTPWRSRPSVMELGQYSLTD